MNLLQMLRREPVRMGQALLILFESGLMAAITFVPSLSATQQIALMGFGMTLVVVGQLGVAEFIRARVTPVADPRDRAGNRLVPEAAVPVASLATPPDAASASVAQSA